MRQDLDSGRRNADRNGRTTWTAFDSEWFNPAGAEGYDFQVRFNGKAIHQSSGATGEVHLDNIRGEAQ